MARKAVQLISRGRRPWLVGISLGRDPDSAGLARHLLYHRERKSRDVGGEQNPRKRKRLVGVLNDDTIPMWRIPTLFSIT